LFVSILYIFLSTLRIELSPIPMNEVKPLSRQAINKSKQDISSSLQDTIVCKLIEDTNQGISDAVIRNSGSYRVQVPAVVFGFPAFSVKEIAQRLKEAYEQSGFDVTVRDNVVAISW